MFHVILITDRLEHRHASLSSPLPRQHPAPVAFAFNVASPYSISQFNHHPQNSTSKLASTPMPSNINFFVSTITQSYPIINQTKDLLLYRFFYHFKAKNIQIPTSKNMLLIMTKYLYFTFLHIYIYIK